LLAFAGVLDKKLAHIARTYEVGEAPCVREVAARIGSEPLGA
jgi:hypothetical protein